MGPKPLLLVDVDGVLNPLPKPRRVPAAYQAHQLRPLGHIRPLEVLLNREHGAQLRALAEVFTIVWATTWEDEANRLLSPILELPDYPVIEWPGTARDWLYTKPHRGSWKSPHVAAWLDRNAPGIPWAWLDDEIGVDDHRLFETRSFNLGGHPSYRLMPIDPQIGVTAADFTALLKWALLR